jgi:hypothetical protein
VSPASLPHCPPTRCDAIKPTPQHSGGSAVNMRFRGPLPNRRRCSRATTVDLATSTDCAAIPPASLCDQDCLAGARAHGRRHARAFLQLPSPRLATISTFRSCGKSSRMNTAFPSRKADIIRPPRNGDRWRAPVTTRVALSSGMLAALLRGAAARASDDLLQLSAV